MYGPSLLTVGNVLIVFVFCVGMLYYVPSLLTVCNVLIVFVFLCRDALCMVLVYSLFVMF